MNKVARVGWWRLAAALAATAPALLARGLRLDLAPVASVMVFGAAVVASAFLLVWAAEAAGHDISGGLATAILAVIAVLPEYAVDLFFAYSAGHDPQTAQFAAANMTGSNRLLLGVGWPLVAILFAWGVRRGGKSAKVVRLEPSRRTELAFLGVACIYSVVIPITRRIAWYDAVVLLSLFAAYLWRSARGDRSEPELIGVARKIGDLPRRGRRAVVAALFFAATAIVLLAAAPFAHGLVAGGRQLGIDEFLLVQWLAPLASEAPELLVAAMLALRGKADASMGILLSAKVNQWTLLVGSLPVAYAIGGGSAAGLPLDGRQTEEFLLTAAQTAMGFAMLADLRFSVREAAILLVLFAVQFLFPQTSARLAFAAGYALIAIVLLVQRRRALPAIARAFRSAS
jgi:cation:H+ antiporter